MTRRYETAEVYSSSQYDGDSLPQRHAVEIAQLIAATWEPEDRLEQFGYSDEDLIAQTAEELLHKPSTHTSLILKDGELVASSFAIPLDEFDPDRDIPKEQLLGVDRERVAYVYITIIEPNSQDSGFLAGLKEDLFVELYRSGYQYALQDSVEEGGFAESGESFYREYESLIASTPHMDFGPEVGPQRRILVDLKEYISVLYERQLIGRGNLRPPTRRDIPSLVEISNLREQINPVEEGNS